MDKNEKSGALLSGENLVLRGKIANECSLPEIGLKDVTPNGSWLEKKQIQAALEERKQLLDAQRIDKIGSLSHAVWRDDMKLAEVTQQVGGHWQYLGQHIDKALYLAPEEALFLMESNCLLLRHNDVTVSLQKAYTLLLDEDFTLTKYKVYASLSRVGYKVFRNRKRMLETTENCLNEVKPKPNVSLINEFKDFPESNSNECMEIVQDTNSLAKGEIATVTAADKETKRPNKENSTKSPILLLKNEIDIDNLPMEIDQETNSSEKVEISSEIKVPTKEVTDRNVPIKNNETGINNIVALIYKSNMPVNITNMGGKGQESQKIGDGENPNNELTVALLTPVPKVFSPMVHDPKIPIPLHDSQHFVNDAETTQIEANATEKASTDTKSNVIDTLSIDAQNTENSTLVVKTTGPEGINSLEIPTTAPLMHTDAKYSTSVPISTTVNDPNVPIPLHDSSVANNVQKTDRIYEISSVEVTSSERVVTNEGTRMEIDENANENIGVLNENMVFPNNIETISPGLPNANVTYTIDEHGIIRISNDAAATDVDSPTRNPRNVSDTIKKDTETKLPSISNYYKAKLQNYNNRKIPSSNPERIKETFNNIPDLCNKHSATIQSPKEELIPRNVFLNQTSYVLNMENVKKFTRRSSTPAAAVDRSPTEVIPQPNPATQMPQFFPNMVPPHFYNPMFHEPPRYNRQLFRPYANWRPYRFPLYAPLYLPRQSHAHPYLHRPNVNYIDMSRVPNPRIQAPRVEAPRTEDKNDYLNIIRSIADRLRQLPSPPMDSLNALRGVINTYNEKYNEKISVTSNYYIVDNSPSVIELDADEPKNKRRSEKYEKYLACVKNLAARLKNFERKNQPSSKQKRALSNLVKNFNKAYDCDFVINSKGDLIDKKIVVLDSSSDSDVAVTEVENKKKRKSMLPNPFSILKRRRFEDSSSSKAVDKIQYNDFVLDDNMQDCMLVDDSTPKSDEHPGLLKYFEKNWLPSEDDFGKAIPCSKSDARLISNNSSELYEFCADQSPENWRELKVKFLTHMKFCTEAISSNTNVEIYGTVKPLISQVPENIPNDAWDCLRIIRNNTDMVDTTLTIDFDVYNRDVHNFKKSKPPKPHFRIVCVEESSKFPSGAEVRRLHTRCDDNTNIVFAVVGLASISYLQVNPKTTTDLSSDLAVEDYAACRKRKRRRVSKH